MFPFYGNRVVLVTYELNTESIERRKRRRRVAKACQGMGQSMHKSVFGYLLPPALWATLHGRLIDEINKEQDSLRFYFLGKNWKPQVEHVGVKLSYDPEGALIV